MGEPVLGVNNHITSFGLNVFCGNESGVESAVGANPDLRRTPCRLGETTPLQVAADKGNRSMVELLFTLFNKRPDAEEKYGSFVNARDKKGRTPIWGLVCLKDESAYETAEYLLEKGANIFSVDSYGNTLLHFMAGCKGVDEKMAEIFLKAFSEKCPGQDPGQLLNGKGVTLFEKAQSSGNQKMIALLTPHSSP